MVTVPITFPKGWVNFCAGCNSVEDNRVAIKLLCNLFGYKYSPPHGKWDHPFWTVDERPLPAAGGQSASSSSNVAPAPAAGGQSASSSSNVAPAPAAEQRAAAAPAAPAPASVSAPPPRPAAPAQSQPAPPAARAPSFPAQSQPAPPPQAPQSQLAPLAPPSEPLPPPTEGTAPGQSGAVDEGAAAGADDEETDFEEDPVEVRNRYLRGIRAKDPVQRKARGNDPPYYKDVVNLFEMRTAWPVDWDRIDELNALVPQWATYAVTPQSLTRSYRNIRDEEINFVQWYRLWALTVQHRFDEFVLSDKFNDARVWHSLPDPGSLGQPLHVDRWHERWAAYRHNDGRVVQGMNKFTNFFKHLFAKHMGEVAMVKLEERRTLWNRDGQWPATFFHPQFAIKAEDRARWAHRRRSAAGDYLTVAEAADIGSTTFMEFAAGGESATFKVAKVLSLPELFLCGCEKFTGLELYFYYNNCMKVVKTRPHAWSSRDNRDAAHLRYQDRLAAGMVPRYGHYRNERPPPPAAAGAARRPRGRGATAP